MEITLRNDNTVETSSYGITHYAHATTYGSIHRIIELEGRWSEMIMHLYLGNLRYVSMVSPCRTLCGAAFRSQCWTVKLRRSTAFKKMIKSCRTICSFQEGRLPNTKCFPPLIRASICYGGFFCFSPILAWFFSDASTRLPQLHVYRSISIADAKLDFTEMKKKPNDAVAAFVIWSPCSVPYYPSAQVEVYSKMKLIIKISLFIGSFCRVIWETEYFPDAHFM